MVRALPAPEFHEMPPAINRTMTPGEWSLLVLLATLWGGSYFYNAVAVRELPALAIVAFRVTGGAALLYVVVRGTGTRMPRDRTAWTGFFVMGFLNNVIPFSLIAWAQGHVASGLAAILNATTPLFAVVFAHYLTSDERMTPGRVGGLIVGFIGVVVMIGPDALHGFSVDVLAELALLLASVFYAAVADLCPSLQPRRTGAAGLGHRPVHGGRHHDAAAGGDRRPAVDAADAEHRGLGGADRARPPSPRPSPTSSTTASWRRPARST